MNVDIFHVLKMLHDHKKDVASTEPQAPKAISDQGGGQQVAHDVDKSDERRVLGQQEDGAALDRFDVIGPLNRVGNPLWGNDPDVPGILQRSGDHPPEGQQHKDSTWQDQQGDHCSTDELSSSAVQPRPARLGFADVFLSLHGD